MKRSFLFFFFLLSFCGCAQVCEFGSTDDSSGLKCFGLAARATRGMTLEEVEKRIGVPARRMSPADYHGTTYDEAWIYDTSPATILYFKGGILKEKDYQHSLGAIKV
ncbi:MAG: hypothetical protein ABIC68_02350 [Candidatus Omnitrophota bacterium]